MSQSGHFWDRWPEVQMAKCSDGQMVKVQPEDRMTGWLDVHMARSPDRLKSRWPEGQLARKPDILMNIWFI